MDPPPRALWMWTLEGAIGIFWDLVFWDHTDALGLLGGWTEVTSLRARRVAYCKLGGHVGQAGLQTVVKCMVGHGMVWLHRLVGAAFPVPWTIHL